MKAYTLLPAFAALFGYATFGAAQSTTSAAGACPTVLTPSYDAPVVGSGWTAQLIATGLDKPRGITFDQNGALLAVQQGSGIVRMTLTDDGGTCLAVNETSTIVENSDVRILGPKNCERSDHVADDFACLAEPRCSTVGRRTHLVCFNLE
jgi:glucose/arabinose dehydrogenase